MVPLSRLTSSPLQFPLQEPIPFERFMEYCLYDPVRGYYRRPSAEIFGRAGDYRTSPHMHELFGHCLARYFRDWFVYLGEPDPFTIWELGSGDGRLAQQIRESLAVEAPRLLEVLDYVEIDLDRGNPGRSMTGIVFSNEFFDALPVHRVRVSGGELQEVYVIQEGERFRETTGPLSDPRIEGYLEEAFSALRDGWTYEVNLRLLDVVRELDRRVERGAVVTVDYGYTEEEYESMPRPAGTLICYRRHQVSDDPCARPGQQDMTSHVHWGMLLRAGQARGWTNQDLISQRRFLMRAGLMEELGREEASGWFSSARLESRLGLKDLLYPGGISDSLQVLVQEVGAQGLGFSTTR